MRIRRLGAALGAGALAAGLVALAAPAGAAEVGATCDAYAVDGNGDPTGDPLATGQRQGTSVSVSAPDQAETGETFDVTLPATGNDVPATIQHPVFGSLTVNHIKNVFVEFAVSGGTVVPGSLAPPAGTISGNKLRFTLPGPYAGGSSFNTPAVSFEVTAGGSPGSITYSLSDYAVTANVTVPGVTTLDTRLLCDPDANTLDTTTVVPPLPEPGELGPIPQSDSATTDVDTPVMIDVLANDAPHPDYPIFPAISPSEPSHGTAEEVDGQVLYTPTTGYSGTDLFEYLICSDVPEEVVEEFAPAVDGFELDPELYCSTAFVSVTINAAAPPTTAGTTTPTTATTAAPVTTAAAQLPKTGSGSSGLAIAGYAALVGGLAVLGAFRRRASA